MQVRAGQGAPLWQWEALLEASGGRGEGTPATAITGFSIDSRSLVPGEVFVALRDVRDGHAFVAAALAAGASAALVESGFSADRAEGALIRVDDTLRALGDIGRAARRRTRTGIVAVTGSAGKTGTKEMLRLCLSSIGETHASVKSYNNKWGVPLSLARMPRACQHAVFEIGMNHAGEIAPLAAMVRPHVAVITTVEPVHLEHFASVAGIARAKAEIFTGLAPGGVAVIPRDNPHFDTLRAAAAAAGARLVTFGYHPQADMRAEKVEVGAAASDVRIVHGTERLAYRLGAPGEHYVRNSLAVLAAIAALGADVARCLPALAEVRAPHGRGQRTLLSLPGGQVLLIDESYNANPASVGAALAAMAATPRDAHPRRIAVLGDMLELGATSGALHCGLAAAIDATAVDVVLACGPIMRQLYDRLPAPLRGGWAHSSGELVPALLDLVRPGDVVVVKGSLGMRMATLVDAMLARYAPEQPGG
jgi:UDP-N-acetylmuramoyl-tripeptide--D-alanyl-D-alanine ligase